MLVPNPRNVRQSKAPELASPCIYPARDEIQASLQKPHVESSTCPGSWNAAEWLRYINFAIQIFCCAHAVLLIQLELPQSTRMQCSVLCSSEQAVDVTVQVRLPKAQDHKNWTCIASARIDCALVSHYARMHAHKSAHARTHAHTHIHTHAHLHELQVLPLVACFPDGNATIWGATEHMRGWGRGHARGSQGAEKLQARHRPIPWVDQEAQVLVVLQGASDGERDCDLRLCKRALLCVCVCEHIRACMRGGMCTWSCTWVQGGPSSLGPWAVCAHFIYCERLHQDNSYVQPSASADSAPSDHTNVSGHLRRQTRGRDPWRLCTSRRSLRASTVIKMEVKSWKLKAEAGMSEQYAADHLPVCWWITWWAA